MLSKPRLESSAGQQRRRIDLEIEELADRVRVLRAVEAVQDLRAREHLGGPVDLRLQPVAKRRVLGGGRPAYAGRRHHSGPQLADHLFPQLRMVTDRGQIHALQGEIRGSGPVVVAGDAVAVEPPCGASSREPPGTRRHPESTGAPRRPESRAGRPGSRLRADGASVARRTNIPRTAAQGMVSHSRQLLSRIGGDSCSSRTTAQGETSDGLWAADESGKTRAPVSERVGRPPVHVRRALCYLMVTLTPAGLGAAGSDLADATMAGDRETVLALLQAGADVDAPQIDGTTALHWAVRYDDPDTAALLIRAGAEVTTANRAGSTADAARHPQRKRADDRAPPGRGGGRRRAAQSARRHGADDGGAYRLARPRPPAAGPRGPMSTHGRPGAAPRP